MAGRPFFSTTNDNVVDNVVKPRMRAHLQNNRQWYRIRNLAPGRAEIAIYDEIGYWGTSAEDFVRDLKAVDATEITLRLNSPGGQIFDGIAIMNALRAHSARVTVQVDSLAASIASVIAQAGDRIVMMPHSQMMIHDGAGLAIGNAADMREMADLLDKQSDNIAAVYAERAGGTPEEWRERMRAETWMTAAEAVEFGLADEVADPPRRRDDEAPPKPGEEEPTAEWLAGFRYAGREKAPAPVNTTPAAEDPKPGPPAAPDPVAQPENAGLSEDVATLIGEQVAEALRAHVAVPTPAPGFAEPAGPEEPGPRAAPEPVAEAPAPEDPWEAIVAHLTEPPDGSDWASLTAHLTTPPAPSSATTA